MMKSLREQIEELSRRKKNLVQVRFVGLNDQPIRVINEAFGLAGDSEQLDLFTSLFVLWFDAARSQTSKVVQREAEIVFGQTFLNWADHRLFFTLNRSGDEFRIWYSFPEVFQPDHVDSAGQGLLAEVRGDSTSVAKYTKIMSGLSSLTGVFLPNGVTIFLCVKKS